MNVFLPIPREIRGRDPRRFALCHLSATETLFFSENADGAEGFTCSDFECANRERVRDADAKKMPVL